MLRFDLRTGAIAEWLTDPPEDFVQLLGFDPDGHPLVFTEKATTSNGEPINAKVLLLTSAGQALQVLATDNSQDPLPQEGLASYPTLPGIGVTDVHGLWMGGYGSIWLYQGQSGHISAGPL